MTDGRCESTMPAGLGLRCEREAGHPQPRFMHAHRAYHAETERMWHWMDGSERPDDMVPIPPL